MVVQPGRCSFPVKQSYSYQPTQINQPAAVNCMGNEAGQVQFLTSSQILNANWAKISYSARE